MNIHSIHRSFNITGICDTATSTCNIETMLNQFRLPWGGVDRLAVVELIAALARIFSKEGELFDTILAKHGISIARPRDELVLHRRCLVVLMHLKRL